MFPTFLPERPALRAGILMVLAMASFTVNDSIVKVLARTLPVAEIMGVRGVMSVALIALIAARQNVLAEAPLAINRAVFLRSACDFVSTLLFIFALMHMQIANLTAINQTVPMAVTGLSALVLGERIGAARLAAIAAGFIGVLMIVRPNPASLTVYDGLALGVVLLVASRDVITRTIPRTIPNLAVALVNAALIAAGGWIISAFGSFITPAPWQVALLAVAAVFLAIGYMLMVTTLRLSDASASAPFRYSVMVFALLSGMIVFHEFPDAIAIAGMAVIVGAGLLLARREAKAQK